MSDPVETGSSAPGDPLDLVDWPVRTDRLLLRRYAPEDADAVWAYRRVPEVGEWLGWYTDVRADFAAHMEAHHSDVVVVEMDEDVIGDLKIAVEDAWGQRDVLDRARGVQAELGWVFAPEAHGHGYATEAVRAALRLCFGPLGLRRATAGAFAANVASVRVMERVGMRCEVRTVKESLHRDHGWLDGIGYAVLAEEFRDE